MSMRLRTTDDGSENDYIRNLSHDVISDILSRLPTKDAVRTSVLSRNWKCKWTSVYNIEIDERSNYFSVENADANFRSVVTGLLLCIQTSRLRTFHLELCGGPRHSGLLGTWISNVLRRNVQRVHIGAFNSQRLDSLWCFSGWNLLTNLRLVMSCTLKIPSDNCFPNLTNLVLVSSVHGDITIITTKVPGTSHIVLIFPVLKFLILANCEFLDVNSVEIQAPKVVHVKHLCESKNYEVKIYAPELVVLELAEHGPFNTYVLSASPAVTYVTFRNELGDETSALRAHKILTKFSNLKCLRIHGKALQALLRLKPGHVFPTFNLLKELEINFSCAIDNVLELLQILPPFESLIINVNTLVVYEFGEVFTSMKVSQLKEVKLLDFSATQGQYHLAEYLLNNVISLQKVTVILLKVASNVPETTDGDGKPIDRVEAVGQYLSKLKVKGSKCEIAVVEQKGTNVWVGSVPSYVWGNR